MKVRDGEHSRSRQEIRTNFRPDLNPAIESGAQEGEGILFHLLMLAEKMLLMNDRAGYQPRFVTFGRFVNVQLATCRGNGVRGICTSPSLCRWRSFAPAIART